MITQKELGDMVRREMKAKGISQVAISRASNGAISPVVMNMAIKGKRPIRVPIACELEKVGIMTAGFWMHLQFQIVIDSYKDGTYLRGITL
jgi:plasmid maintenance system antidote protein VapI